MINQQFLTIRNPFTGDIAVCKISENINFLSNTEKQKVLRMAGKRLAQTLYDNKTGPKSMGGNNKRNSGRA